MGRDMGDDHPKQDTQLVDLLRRILGNLDVGDSIGSRKRDEERHDYSNINGFATNSAFFFSDRTSESYKGFNKGRQWDMRNRDVESIRKQVKDIEAVSPIIWGNRSDKNIVFGQLSGTYNVKGVQPDYFKIETQQLYYGRLLNEIDEIEKRKVCLIGAKVNEVLFKGSDPCGKYIRVNGIYYQVVGVTKQRASSVNIGGRAKEKPYPPFQHHATDAEPRGYHSLLVRERQTRL